MRTMVLVIILVCVPNLLAAEPTRLFEKGNQLYQQGRFAESVAAYEEIVASGYVSPELFFNLGNAYYKSGALAKAILNYERARKLAPNDEDLQHNLTLANMMITDRIETVPRLFVWDWWDALRSAVSLNSATWMTYAVYVLLIAFIMVIVLSTSYTVRRNAAILAAIGVLVLMFSAVILAAKINEAQRDDMAIIMANIVNVKNSPDQNSTDAFVLHAGVKVTLTDKVNDWYKIRLADGKLGWVEASVFEVI